jgi:hypothetical protein
LITLIMMMEKKTSFSGTTRIEKDRKNWKKI